MNIGKDGGGERKGRWKRKGEKRGKGEKREGKKIDGRIGKDWERND